MSIISTIHKTITLEIRLEYFSLLCEMLSGPNSKALSIGDERGITSKVTLQSSGSKAKLAHRRLQSNSM